MTTPPRQAEMSTASPPNQPAAASTTGEQRVSTLIGDRLCAKCGYNLTGQAVLREPHYHMLIVRCPECATVASMQEYPLLGRWANRWAALLAGIWMLVVVGLWIGTGATIFGFSLGTAETAAQRYGNQISDQFEQWLTARAAAQGNAAAQGFVSRNVTDWNEWWNQQDPSKLFAGAGGWIGAVEWQALFIWIPYAFTVFALACIWSVVLLGQRWNGRLVVMLLIMLIAMFLSSISYIEWQNDYGWSWNSGRRKVGPIVLGMSLIFGAIVLSTGVLVGRSVIRGMVRLLLPPRLRYSLAILWTTDGLQPPIRAK